MALRVRGGRLFENKTSQTGVNYAPQDIGPATQLGGTVLTVVLIVAGVGLVIGNSFTSSKFDHSSKSRRSSSQVGGRDYQDLVKAHLTQYAGKKC